MTTKGVAHRIASGLRNVLVPHRGDLVQIVFHAGTREWRRVLIPDDSVVGLCRELILQGIYPVQPVDGGTGLVIDAGAHTGIFSLMAGQVADRVLAIEPDPENFRILDLNLFRNNASNVTPINGALWRESGSVSFQPAAFTEGGTIATHGDMTVPAVSLDDLIAEHGPVDYLKIDVEGAEFDVLGTTGRLDAIAAIVGELHVRDAAQIDKLLARLATHGFSVKLISEAALSRPRHTLKVLRNWRRIRGHTRIKVLAVAYFLTAGRFGAARGIGQDMPLFVAVRATKRTPPAPSQAPGGVVYPKG